MPISSSKNQTKIEFDFGVGYKIGTWIYFVILDLKKLLKSKLNFLKKKLVLQAKWRLIGSWSFVLVWVI
jgi:hypothetical protein